MTKLNPQYRKLPGSYLFSEVARRVAEFSQSRPDRSLLRLGIGDVKGPLAPAVAQAMSRAALEMGGPQGFRGYGPEQGYPFLRRAIAEHEYWERGADISPDEIFISDGAKSDCSGIGDLFGTDNTVALCDPVYPVYVDASAMAGRAGEYDRDRGRWTGLMYLPCTAENGFVPDVPEERADLIYLCFPNNPTGAMASRAQLSAWVDYAKANGSVILYDGAYEAFISRPELPRSIFEIPGARGCAIEFRSFSKTAGFTGVRCGYAVIPRELEREGVSLHALWSRRQASKFNGVSYITQRGAQAVYTPEGWAQVRAAAAACLDTARLIREGLSQAGLEVWGGVHSPYLWAKTPGGLGSWAFFELLLERAGVVATPGAGFGPGGEGYVRFSALGDRAEAVQAVERIWAALG